MDGGGPRALPAGTSSYKIQQEEETATATATATATTTKNGEERKQQKKMLEKIGHHLLESNL